MAIGVAVLALALVAMLALAEGTLLAMPPEGLRRLQRFPAAIDRLVARRRRLLWTVTLLRQCLLGAMVLAAITALPQAIEGAWYGFSFVVGTGCLVALVGELLPRALATSPGALLATRATRPVIWLDRALATLLDALDGVASRLAALVVTHYAPPPERLTPEELAAALAALRSEGRIGSLEEDRIKRLLSLSRRTVGDVMRPRVDVVAIGDDQRIASCVELVAQARYSRMPVYHGTADDMVGVVHAKDLLARIVSGQSAEPTLRDSCRPLHHVPEMMHLTDLLREFQHKKIHIAVAVDEFGGTAGIVGFEDLLEEIVGDIKDEHDEELTMVTQINPSTWLLDGRLPIADAVELLGVEMTGETTTVGGFVFDRLGHLPRQGETLVHGGLEIEVLSCVRRRVAKVRVTRRAIERGPGRSSGT